MKKTIVLLGKAHDDFQNWYLQQHKEHLLTNHAIYGYVANLISPPTQELIDGGWGWGGEDKSGICGVDELWSDDECDVLATYESDANIIGAYSVRELVMRPCYPDWPEGTPSHWVKRIGLLKCFDEQRPEDFFRHWEFIHGPKAIKHHTGAGKYIQNHIKQDLKSADIKWNGIVMLSYWNADAFHYGHFSRHDSVDIIKADGACFMDIFLALHATEYVQKRPPEQEE